MFVLPEVQAEFKKFVKVHLYTDRDEFFKLQDKLIKVSTLPSYVVLKPGSEEVVGFIGYPPNPNTRVQDFAKFLADHAEKAMN